MELISNMPETQSILEEEIEVNTIPFKIATFSDYLRKYHPKLSIRRWSTNTPEKLIDLIYSSQQSQTSGSFPSVESPPSTSGLTTKERGRSFELWGEHRVNDLVENLCDSSGADLGGIPQSVLLQNQQHTNAIAGGIGTGPYRVQIKIYNTEDISNLEKTEWWKRVITTMQFTMGTEDSEYDMLAEVTTLVTNKLKSSDNFHAEKKKRFLAKK